MTDSMVELILLVDHASHFQVQNLSNRHYFAIEDLVYMIKMIVI